MRSARWRGVAGYVLLGFTLYIAFLLITIPAWWLAKIPDSPGSAKFALQDLSGTLWNGECRVSVTGQRGNELALLRWHLSPWRLLFARAHVKLDAQGEELSGRLTVSLGIGSLTVDDANVTVPAGLIGRFYPAAGFIEPEGQVQLQATTLNWKRGELNGQATLTWLSAGLRNYRLSQLGDYALRLDGRGNVVEVQLNTVRGDLDLSGRGEWRADNGGMLRMQGYAEARTRQQELDPLLALIGGNTGEGRRQFNLNLPMPL